MHHTDCILHFQFMFMTLYIICEMLAKLASVVQFSCYTICKEYAIKEHQRTNWRYPFHLIESRIVLSDWCRVICNHL